MEFNAELARQITESVTKNQDDIMSRLTNFDAIVLFTRRDLRQKKSIRFSNAQEAILALERSNTDLVRNNVGLEVRYNAGNERFEVLKSPTDD